MLEKLNDNELKKYKELFENCSKRAINAKIKGMDTKFLYHVVRLIDECQMIFEEQDLDLTRSREHLKAIRRGEWSEERVIEYFDKKLIHLEDLYNKSTLPYSPDEEAIRGLLMECLEMHYGIIEEYTDTASIFLQLGIAEDAIERARRMLK